MKRDIFRTALHRVSPMAAIVDDIAETLHENGGRMASLEPMPDPREEMIVVEGERGGLNEVVLAMIGRLVADRMRELAKEKP